MAVVKKWIVWDKYFGLSLADVILPLFHYFLEVSHAFATLTTICYW
jgi:hypothetical protein